MSKHHPNSLVDHLAADAVVTPCMSDHEATGCAAQHPEEGLSVSRRRLLQMMSVAGVLPGVAFALDQTLDQTTAKNITNAESVNCQQQRSHDLLIDIISSSAVPDDTVVISNNTADDIELAGFLPSIIVFHNKFVDLGALGGNEPVVLNAGQVISFQTQLNGVRGKAWDALGGKRIQYVWADDAVREISEEMQLVSVAGFLSDQQAILYSNTRRLTAAAVVPV